MKKINIFIVFVLFFSWFYVDFGVAIANDAGEKIIKLTQPKYDGEISVERALKERRSIRSYKTEPLTLDIISQILWAAQGVTEPQRGLRTAPSARAQYLLEVYLVAGNITNLKPGIYRYIPKDHTLLLISHGEMKEKLYSAAGQAPIKAAPCALLITGHANRSKNPGWMYLEAGHAAQNVYLQAVSLNLATVVMAGFNPEEVKKALPIPEQEQPIYIMPLGKK